MKKLLVLAVIVAASFYVIGGTVEANTTNIGQTNVNFENPLSVGTVDGLLQQILGVIQGIVAALATLFIVIGGVLYITSGGDEGRISTAKKCITYALIGLAIGIAAPSLLREIYTALGATNNPAAASPSLTEIAMNVLRFLLGIIGVLSVLMIVVGGVLYITSAGDSARADSARKIITYAIIGLVISLLSLFLVTQVVQVLT